MQQEVVLAMLAKEPSHGYELRARLRQALGPLGEALNAGQVYVTLTRLEKAGLVVSERADGLADRPDRKVYGLTPDGQQRVAEWLAEVSWPKPDLAEFHLKLVAAAAAGLADPLTHRGRAAPRVAAPAARRPAGRDGRAGRLGRRAVVGGHRAAAAGGPALAGGVRAELDRPKEWIMTDTADTSVLRARGLRKHYGQGEGLVRAVDGVDLDVAPGETVAVMGPSGCGKSTLLHLLGGLDRPSGGEVSLAGRRIDQIGEKALARMRRTAVGFVFQAFHLMDELTAVENVELPALLAGRSPRAARRRAADLLERVGLADRARSCPRRCRAASASGSRSPGR